MLGHAPTHTLIKRARDTASAAIVLQNGTSASEEVFDAADVPRDDAWRHAEPMSGQH
jgi:hypothetical protein